MVLFFGLVFSVANFLPTPLIGTIAVRGKTVFFFGGGGAKKNLPKIFSLSQNSPLGFSKFHAKKLVTLMMI